MQPSTGPLLVAEYDPNVDNEIELLQINGNYDLGSFRGGTPNGHDESVPMTDLRRFSGTVLAVLSSGRDTEAICGAVFITGAQWGGMQGLLAVTARRRSCPVQAVIEHDTIVVVDDLPF